MTHEKSQIDASASHGSSFPVGQGENIHMPTPARTPIASRTRVLGFDIMLKKVWDILPKDAGDLLIVMERDDF